MRSSGDIIWPSVLVAEVIDPTWQVLPAMHLIRALQVPGA